MFDGLYLIYRYLFSIEGLDSQELRRLTWALRSSGRYSSTSRPRCCSLTSKLDHTASVLAPASVWLQPPVWRTLTPGRRARSPRWLVASTPDIFRNRSRCLRCLRRPLANRALSALLDRYLPWHLPVVESAVALATARGFGMGLGFVPSEGSGLATA